jgi:SAM-dependent methyltransferase
MRGAVPAVRRAVSVVGRYRCSVCGRSVIRFDPLPAELVEQQRQHGYPYTSEDAETCNAAQYSCPWCGAPDRERLYALYLKQYFRGLAPKDTVRMVDFAPNPSLSSFIRKLIADSAYNVAYRTADLSAEGVDDRVDIMDLNSYADSSVDFFICSHVLEHVADDRKALGELHRILKRGGQGILVVPIAVGVEEIDEDPSVTDPAERWRRFGQDDHLRQYSKKGFLLRVEQASFKVQELGAEHFGQSTFRKHGITERSILYIVEKK